MKPGAWAAFVLAVGGMFLMGFAFLAQASPYVTVAQARSMEANNLHVAGTLDEGTLFNDAKAGVVRFRLTDEKGETMSVVYHGHQPANMNQASQVVAVGGMRDGQFHARRLMLKCPTRYEASPWKEIESAENQGA